VKRLNAADRPVYDGILCNVPVRVFVLPKELADSGSGYWPRPGFAASIRLGLSGDWSEVYETLSHEAFEMALDFRGLSYDSPRWDDSKNTGSRLFVLDHVQFTEIVHQASLFVMLAEPGVRKAWLKVRGRKQ
jgi:hypothetical protein